MRMILSWAAFGILLTAVIIGSIVFRSSLYGEKMVQGKLVEIRPDLTGAQIAQVLFDEGVIRNKRWFLRIVRKKSLDGKLQAGIYEFKGRPYIGDVIKMLARGEIARVKFTVTEGMTIMDIGAILEEHAICTKEKFVNFARKEKLEGYLFPDTYVFPVGISKEAVAKRMVERFYEVLNQVYGDTSNLTRQKLEKIVTIASIVEKEAEKNNERAIIASVFYNRLNLRIPLQSCATIMYVIGNKRVLKLADLKIRNPYNTYQRKGLPPTPICNPGRESLKAAIYPAHTPYLFFVSKGDGTHQFSTTYSDHLKAKILYLDTRVETSVQ